MGVIYVGPKDDYGWNQAHAEGAAGLSSVAGIKVVEEANVPTVTHQDIYAHLSQWNKTLADLGRGYARAAPPSLLQDLRDLRQSILETQRTLITPTPEGEGDHAHQDR